MSKAKGNEAKEIQFAVSMANSIKGKEKALTRYEAALELLGKDHPAVTIFGEKAIDLGNDVDLKAGPKVKNTLGKLGSADITGKKAGRDQSYSRQSYGRGANPILPLGSTNLATGKCKVFNIYETWGDDNSTTIELWDTEQTGSSKDYRLLFTSGGGPIAQIGTAAMFQHDQTSRPLWGGRLLDWAQIGDADLLMQKYKFKSAPGYVYK